MASSPKQTKKKKNRRERRNFVLEIPRLVFFNKMHLRSPTKQFWL